ncbi:hypothetical protein PYCC9005_004845 [Savitreella phatthalungensis]
MRDWLSIVLFIPFAFADTASDFAAAAAAGRQACGLINNIVSRLPSSAAGSASLFCNAYLGAKTSTVTAPATIATSTQACGAERGLKARRQVQSGDRPRDKRFVRQAPAPCPVFMTALGTAAISNVCGCLTKPVTTTITPSSTVLLPAITPTVTSTTTFTPAATTITGSVSTVNSTLTNTVNKTTTILSVVRSTQTLNSYSVNVVTISGSATSTSVMTDYSVQPGTSTISRVDQEVDVATQTVGATSTVVELFTVTTTVTSQSPLMTKRAVNQCAPVTHYITVTAAQPTVYVSASSTVTNRMNKFTTEYPTTQVDLSTQVDTITTTIISQSLTFTTVTIVTPSTTTTTSTSNVDTVYLVSTQTIATTTTFTLPAPTTTVSVVSTVATATATCVPNIVVNGGFEDSGTTKYDAPPWTVTQGQEISFERQGSGPNPDNIVAFYHIGSPSGPVLLTQTLNTKKNIPYDLSFSYAWIGVHAAGYGTAGTCSLRVTLGTSEVANLIQDVPNSSYNFRKSIISPSDQADLVFTYACTTINSATIGLMMLDNVQLLPAGGVACQSFPDFQLS